jgi:hypothetical protein
MEKPRRRLSTIAATAVSSSHVDTMSASIDAAVVHTNFTGVFVIRRFGIFSLVKTDHSTQPPKICLLSTTKSVNSKRDAASAVYEALENTLAFSSHRDFFDNEGAIVGGAVIFTGAKEPVKGAGVGTLVGTAVGIFVGAIVGAGLGETDGFAVGSLDG